MRPSRRFRVYVARAFRGLAPAKVLLLGYLTCVVLGWIALSLPWAQALPGTSSLDHLFIATSVVSTTGEERSDRRWCRNLHTAVPGGPARLLGNAWPYDS